MERKSIFTKVLQVGLVVRNLDEAVKKYEQCGIGPWEIVEYGPFNLDNLTVRGQRVDFSMRAAFSKIGDVGWELLEPLDDKSNYAEFLRDHGEGLHHIAFQVNDFKETITLFETKGVGALQSGQGFAYLDTANLLSCIAEIYDKP